MPHHKLPSELVTPAGLIPHQIRIDFSDIAVAPGPPPRVEAITVATHLGNQARELQRVMDAAAKKAGQLWQDHATRLAEQYLARIQTRPFMAEDLRAYCYAQGLAHPKSERAWGTITRRLQNTGRIFAHGTAKVKNPKAHKANATSWSTVPDPRA